MLMRKYQIETYQREVPAGGYVVSVIRDFPKAAMGLIDYQNQPKTSAQDWKFQRDQMILVETENDRRSFTAGSENRFTFTIKNNLAEKVPDRSLVIEVLKNRVIARKQVPVRELLPGESFSVSFNLSMPRVQKPTRLTLYPYWADQQQVQVNQWDIWVFPQTSRATRVCGPRIGSRAGGSVGNRQTQTIRRIS